MNTGTYVKFDAGHHAVVVLLGLGALLGPSPSLATCKDATVELLKLYWQHATCVLPSCVCYLAHCCVRITTLAQLPGWRSCI